MAECHYFTPGTEYYTNHVEPKLARIWTKLLVFEGREDYLAWVKAWKATYAEMSIERREWKLKYKIWQREMPTRKFSVWPPKQKWTRATRREMLRIRAEGKLRSKQLRDQRLAKEGTHDIGP